MAGFFSPQQAFTEAIFRGMLIGDDFNQDRGKTMNQFGIEKRRQGEKTAAVLVAFALILTSVLGSVSASAQTTSNPVIFFNGNLLSNQAVHSEIVARPDLARLELDPLPLTRVMTTDRLGYTFGGWSYAPGEAAVSVLTAPTESTSRILYAVWNSKINLDLNGATRGSVAGGATSIDYRFGQTATLPLVGTLKRKGYEFAGWNAAGTTAPFVTTYKAKFTDNGGATFVASWKKTVTFVARNAVGTVPAPVTYFAGPDRISLPTVSEVALTRTGFTFAGWARSENGKPIKKPGSFLPKKKNLTLHAVWKKD
jgi:uncharacterized repeat protein (TIGR02543 family)